MSDPVQTDEPQSKTAMPSLPSQTFRAVASPTTAKARTSVTRRLFLTLCVLPALLHPIASLLSPYSWLADLMSHFQEPALVVTLAAAFFSLAAKGRRTAIGLIVMAMFQVAPLIRYGGSNPALPDPGSKQRVRILMTNVLFDNWMHADLIHLIHTEKPDVIGFVEYTPMWDIGLKEIAKEYPYQVNWPKGPSGLALWFKTKPKTIDSVQWLVADGNPVIHAVFEFAGKDRHLWLVHPRSPLKLRRWVAGNPEIDAIADTVRRFGGSRIVVGDMNSTDGSRHFRDFIEVSGLRDSRLGFGRQGSWPTDMPYRIAIDHAFVSEDLAVVDRKLGHMVGSDHFPLIIDLAPALPTNSATHADQKSTRP